MSKVVLLFTTCFIVNISITVAEQVNFEQEDVKRLRKWTLRNPFDRIESNPFLTTEDTIHESTDLCAIRFYSELSEYELITLKSKNEATENMHITHKGHCGVCSTVADLAVYIENPYLVNPLPRCGLWSFFSHSRALHCLRQLGFTAPCADMWYYNIVQLKGTCFKQCFWNFLSREIVEDHSPDSCFTCIKNNLVPTFLKIAARTMSNSGIVSAIQRSSTEIPEIDLSYISKVEPIMWQQPEYAKPVIEGLRAKVLVNEFPRIPDSPYEQSIEIPTVPTKEVCAVIYHDELHKKYSLQTYNNEMDAAKAHAIVTHKGPCGVCSTLQDLSVYIEQPDLTGPGRRCAFKSFVSRDWAISCFMELGFTASCADIWFHNAQHTRKACLSKCLFSFLENNNYPDGSLSPCIECDEVESGPIFKKISARTRRNSGLISAISRPGPAIYKISHEHHSCAASDVDDDVCVDPSTLAQAVNLHYDN